MKNNVTTGSPENSTGVVVRPRLLKNSAPLRFMNVKIGQLAVELWEYRDPQKEPFARLSIESRSFKRKHKEFPGQTEDTLQVELDVWHASALSSTIETWLAALIHVPRKSREPYLRAQVDRVSLTLHHPTRKRVVPKAALTLGNSSGQVGTVILTDLEANMLSNTLMAIHDDVQKTE